MNKCKVFSKMWFLVLLLVAFAAGCAENGGDPGTLVSVAVTPATASIPVNVTQQFTAIATYGDGSARDVTKLSAWTAPDLVGGVLVAKLSPDGVGGGLATSNAVGTSHIKATFGGMSGSAILTVNNATVVSINVTPSPASISVGNTQPFKAFAIFNDGSTPIDVTINPGTTWNSASTGVATFVAPPVVNGIATGVAVGTSNITASYSGKTSPVVILAVTAPNSGPAGSYPNLRTAAPYGIIAYNAITDASAGKTSHIFGDVALTQPGPGGTIASVTGPGFKDGGVAPLLTSTDVTTSNGVTPGLITAANNGTPANIAALPQLLIDLRAVYNDLLTRAAPVTPLTTPATAAAAVGGGTFPAAAPDLSGYVLSPGIYTTAGTYGLSNTLGPLVLDAGGNADALFIIRSTAVGPSGLTSTTGSVVLRNGAQSKNVYWLLDNATIGANTFFQGTVVAGHAITLLAHANVEGRMLAGALGLVSGAVVLTDTNVISVPK